VFLKFRSVLKQCPTLDISGTSSPFMLNASLNYLLSNLLILFCHHDWDFPRPLEVSTTSTLYMSDKLLFKTYQTTWNAIFFALDVSSTFPFILPTTRLIEDSYRSFLFVVDPDVLKWIIWRTGRCVSYPQRSLELSVMLTLLCLSIIQPTKTHLHTNS